MHKFDMFQICGEFFFLGLCMADGDGDKLAALLAKRKAERAAAKATSDTAIPAAASTPSNSRQNSYNGFPLPTCVLMLLYVSSYCYRCLILSFPPICNIARTTTSAASD